MAGNTPKAAEAFNCLSGKIVDKYAELANQFTQDLSHALQPAMWNLLGAVATLWIVMEGLRLITFRTTIEDIAREFTLLIIAAFLLAGQGPNLVNDLYSASLSMMGGAANVALQVGNHSAISSNDLASLGTGMHALTCTVEKGAKTIFNMSSLIAQTGNPLNPMPWLYAILLITPYFLVVVVYFSLVVLSIFRIQMIAILSPFLMLGFGFPWGRNMLQSGLKALVGTFMVLFGGTAAVAVMLYAVSSLFPNGTPTAEEADAMASIYNEQFIVALMMGWLGMAFMTEATGMTNSISPFSPPF